MSTSFVPIHNFCSYFFKGYLDRKELIPFERANICLILMCCQSVSVNKTIWRFIQFESITEISI